MIITLTMNPAVDKTAELDTIQVGGLNRLKNIVMDAGGKGINVSKTIHNLNGNSIAVAIVGGNAGNFIENEMKRLQVNYDFMYIDGNSRTNLKIVDQDKVLTEFNENGPSPNAEQLQKLSQKIESMLKEDDILVLSGSVPKEVKKDYYYDLIRIAKNKNAKTILDADGELFKEGIKAIPTIIKPNRYELLQYYNAPEDTSEKQMILYAKAFIDQGVELVVVSMGKDGSYFINKDAVYKVEPLKIEAHSSVGAGDAMVASLAYGVENKLSDTQLIVLSSACSAGAVMTQGTKPADLALIEELKKQVQYKKIEM